MTHRPSRSEGFGLTMVLLAVVVAAGLAAAGLYVYRRAQPPKSVYTVSQDGTRNQTVTAQGAVVTYPLFASLPESLQSSIKTSYKQLVPGCMDGTTFSAAVDQNALVSRYLPERFAIVSIGCDGGAAGLFIYQNQTWQLHSRTQYAYDCNIIDAHRVPAELLAADGMAASCAGTDGQLKAVTYPLN